MPQPLTIQPQAGPNAGTTVASIDASGNESITGTMTVQGALYLGAQAAAPAAVPGQVALYTTNGTSISYVGAGGVAVGQTVSGNFTVNGTAKITGTTEIDSQLNLIGAASGSTAIAASVSGDTSSRLALTAGGVLTFGPGNAATDTNLYRAATALLQTDSSLQLNSSLTVAGAATVNNQLAINRSSDSSAVVATYTTTANVNNGAYAYAAQGATGRFLNCAVSGDANQRFVSDVNGAMAWGTGAAARDTTLSRTGVGVLTATGLTVTNLLTTGGGTSTAGSAPVLAPTFANGTAAQLTDTTRDYMVYLQIGTAGTAFTLQIGPTSGVANTIMASATPLSDQLLTIRLPAGWFLKWAGTTTTLTTQTAIGC